MITKAHIIEVDGLFELHFTERFPYKTEPERSWVDVKPTREQTRQIAQEAHSFHIINLVSDLHNELIEINSPILEPLADELSNILSTCTANYTPNHKQLCREISFLWHYMSLVTTDKAKIIALELQDTVKYEMSNESKKWILGTVSEE